MVLGILAQWAAWRFGLPSILLLLPLGVLAGPATGFLQPDQLLGPLLLPLVSLSAAIILFEGGLRLRLRELHGIGGVFFQLITVGVLITWVVTVLAARFLLKFPWPLAILLGAILVVTGPTVIGPLLRNVRLGGRVGALLKWEGIVIDPVGAMLAVLVFEGALAGGVSAWATAGFLKTLVVGGVVGVLGAEVLVLLLRRYWIPDYLHNAASLMAVVAIFTGADQLQDQSGLLAVTLMGIVLANQKRVTVKHIIEFKEHLSILLLSALFIVLAARLRRSDLAGLDLSSFLFLALLVVVARPAAVLLSTMRSPLTWQERLYLSCMAPRGIIAAAVSSVFALEMTAAGFEGAGRLVPITFLVIFGTVALYGLSAAMLARRLRLAQPNPQGVFFIGAHPLARELASALQAAGCPVLLADSNWSNVAAARLAGLNAYFGSVLSEQAGEELDLGEMGRLLALTPNDEVNSLACLRFMDFFGRREVYQLPFEPGQKGRREAVSLEQRGRLLFGPERTSAHLQERFGDHPAVKATRLTKEFDYDAFRALHGDSVLPVFLLLDKGEVVVFTWDDQPAPQPGQLLLSLTRPALEGARASARPAEAKALGKA